MDRKLFQTYISSKYQYLLEHKYEQRLQHIQNTWNPINAEALDQDFQQPSQIAAKQCKRKPQIDIVRELSSLWAENQILQKLILQARTQVVIILPIHHLKNKHPNIKIPLQKWLITWKSILLQSIQEGTWTSTNQMHNR